MAIDRKKLEKSGRDLARTIHHSLPRGVGFALFLFDEGEGGHLTYLSSGAREEMIRVVNEWLDRQLAGQDVTDVLLWTPLLTEAQLDAARADRAELLFNPRPEPGKPIAWRRRAEGRA